MTTMTTEDLIALWQQVRAEAAETEEPIFDRVAVMLVAQVGAEEAIMVARRAHDDQENLTVDPLAPPGTTLIEWAELRRARWSRHLRMLARRVWEHRPEDAEGVMGVYWPDAWHIAGLLHQGYDFEAAQVVVGLGVTK